MDESPPTESPRFRDLTHELSNSLAYVVTNLNLLSEELQGAEPRVKALVEDALEGSERIGELLRTMRRVSWGVEAANPPPTETAPAPQARILVVDDEEAILTAVKRALRSHEVAVAANGEEAMRKLEGGTFDLVLCDLMMPGMTGIDLYEQLAREKNPHLKRLVFMTAGGFTTDVRRFLARVDNGVLHKPFDVKTLRWVVSQKLKEHAAK
ncbi:MAG: response regulator [Alphaproteobacteria bacterium]|nr:response regulator [Alphaproteobacteria bacterium]